MMKFDYENLDLILRYTTVFFVFGCIFTSVYIFIMKRKNLYYSLNNVQESEIKNSIENDDSKQEQVEFDLSKKTFISPVEYKHYLPSKEENSISKVSSPIPSPEQIVAHGIAMVQGNSGNETLFDSKKTQYADLIETLNKYLELQKMDLNNSNPSLSLAHYKEKEVVYKLIINKFKDLDREELIWQMITFFSEINFTEREELIRK